MNKLMSLKQWVTVLDAAHYLSAVWNSEPVSEADVLHMGLDGHLRLSVKLVNYTAVRPAKFLPIPKENIFEKPLANGATARGFQGLFLPINHEGTHVVEVENKSRMLKGLFDLPMIGNEKTHIENLYHPLIGGPLTRPSETYGAFVERRDGPLYQLQSRDKTRKYSPFFPALSLPEDALIVVRTEALQECAQAANGAPKGSDKPLTTTERNTLLVIIAALCKGCKLDYEGRHAARIARMTDELGAPVSPETVRRHLDMIPNALESRGK